MLPSLFRLPTLLLLFTVGFASAAQADNYCAAPNASQSLIDDSELEPLTTEDGLTVVADSATLGNNGVTHLSGNVAMRREEGVLRADELKYDERNQLINANNNVAFQSEGLEVNSQQASVNLLDNTAQFQQATFMMTGENSRGSAAQIDIDGNGTPDMRGVRYTTCPPDNESWILQADRIRLDQSTGQGKANNVSLRFKGVPLLYLPYLQFPFTDQRQSGLLAPIFKSSDSNGVEFGIPYYWNIAPNVDATFTPSYLSKRGWRLDTELRGVTGTPLSQRSGRRWWQANSDIQLDWLPEDDVTNRSRQLFNANIDATGQNRKQSWLWQNQLIDVTDQAWFDDFGSDLASVSQPFFVSRSSGLWHHNGERSKAAIGIIAEDHNPLSNNATTLISRQPELSAELKHNVGGSPFSLGLKTQLGRFNTQAAETITQRIHYQPQLMLDLQKPGWWFTTKAEYWNTRWKQETQGQPDLKAHRSLPIYSSELGLHLEKPYKSGHHAIEPVIAFRAAPFREQSSIPVLDTHSETLYWHNLNDDQFSGLDRVRDGQQLSTTFASRWYNKAGEERVSFRLGQIWYLDKAKVTLPGEAAIGDRSNTLFEFNAAIGDHWRVSTAGEWDSQDKHIDHRQLRVDLSDPQLGDFYVALRERRDVFRQASIGGKRQISSQWYTDVSGLYSLDNEEFLEANLKLRYQTCCWAVDFGGSRVLRDSNGEPDIGFFIQLELTGLAQIGTQ